MTMRGVERIAGSLRREAGAPGVAVCALAIAALIGGLAPARADGTAPDRYLKALSQQSAKADVSPLPNYSGDYVSLGAEGQWHRPGDGAIASVYGYIPVADEDPAPDCSPDAIVHYARKAPDVFEIGKRGLLYGVETHTPATRVTTRYWDMPGFNSCALVVYAILKRAGCSWAKYTANAKGIYDMAAQSGWRPSTSQRGGCMVAWNSRWDGSRARIGRGGKQGNGGGTLFRHVGIATGSWLSVDNSSWLGRPTTFFTYRPVIYESPMFLCPPADTPKQQSSPPQAKK